MRKMLLVSRAGRLRGALPERSRRLYPARMSRLWATPAGRSGESNSRPKVSGLEHRVSASSRVILPAADQVRQRGVHRLHPELAARLDGARDLVRAPLADVMPHRRRGHEDLAGHDAPAAVARRQQLLRADAHQRRRELHPHLRLLVRREHVDDAVDGLGGVLRVQRGEHQVPGLGRGERRGHGLGVAHLAHQDDVGVLAEHAPEGAVEALACRSRPRAGSRGTSCGGAGTRWGPRW